MPLPDLIEIVPLEKPVRAEITVPGSKSITNRALILAALAKGRTTLRGALWSEDTQVMMDCLQKLGFVVEVKPDPDEFCNRTITVEGLGGKIPNEGTAEKPLELFVGNAGTAARFLSALVCLGSGAYRVAGIPRMNERPKAALFQALRELGYRVESPTDKLPALIFGTGPRPGAKCTVDIAESSQFASALLLGASVGGWNVKVIGENAEESPYVAMTSKLIEAFPKSGGEFQIEPDTSSGSYFWAVQRLVPRGPEHMEFSEKFGVEVSTWNTNEIKVAHWPNSGWQMDEPFMDYLMLGNKARGLRELDRKRVPMTPELLSKLKSKTDKWVFSRQFDLGDSIMTAIVWAAEEGAGFLLLDEKAFRFIDLGRLRLQETERVIALRTELRKCGARIEEEGDTLTVYSSELHGAEIETYDDHRMAMCFAILGLKVPGIKIKNPACVKKTFPNFFQKLAAPPPAGLGAIIRDGKTGRELHGEELFAE